MLDINLMTTDNDASSVMEELRCIQRTIFQKLLKPAFTLQGHSDAAGNDFV